MQLKDDIGKDFSRIESTIRILLCTEAFSMGVDIPDIRQVIHIGAPTTLDSKCVNL
jgi:superfamily II DNA helicase RecQ